MPGRFPLRTRTSRTVLAGGLTMLALGLTGCSSFTPLIGAQPLQNVAAAATPTPSATPDLVFDSVFTDMGSVHPTLMIGDDLELQLDMWTEQKTHEWYTDSEKLFSFVINVFDRSVPADAPFAAKRLVYMSNISVTATTSTTSGASVSPFVLDTDPLLVTLDPEALRSADGLLITSPKGGFQLESNQIGTLSADTYGVMLDFAMTISAESSAGAGGYTKQIVHVPVPVAIFPRA
ncbi:hypothetical protein [Cryobacterium sp. PAMC25264]|uniref:hypothetical protein n=1 Tax=Cryobacterium sp. PAMC25264 TaxID=2861288 RepID=UPI001C628A49|nr:hypothetical protein [Cryobacterium sp. PAMC25264]QYF74801.1 hypothetical protein KY500_06515 [Cryobacterium sp. PAMC25264]